MVVELNNFIVMIQEFSPVIIPSEGFSPDIYPVSQLGWINLRVVMETGVVPADLQGTEPTSNNIDDPRGILGRPDDIFSAMRANDAYKSIAFTPVGDSSASSSMSPEEAQSA